MSGVLHHSNPPSFPVADTLPQLSQCKPSSSQDTNQPLAREANSPCPAFQPSALLLAPRPLFPTATRLGFYTARRKSMQLAARGRAPPRPIRRKYGMGPPRDRREHRAVDPHSRRQRRWLHHIKPGRSYCGARARWRRRRFGRRRRQFLVETALQAAATAPPPRPPSRRDYDAAVGGSS